VNVLDRILARKVEEVRELRASGQESELRARARDADPPRGFLRALREGPRPAVIAEFKRASPSKGVIRAGATPEEIAKQYEAAGAAAMSVLTDVDFFQGSLDDLERARASVSLPVLRKDFTIDEIQLVEARAHGADAILLIVAALEDTRLAELADAARGLGLDVLVEVHSGPELERARAIGAELVGVNNRDLKTFVTDVAVTRSLLPQAAGMTLVSESGLDSPETVAALAAEGVAAFLIGEALMRAAHPGDELRRIRGRA